MRSLRDKQTESLEKLLDEKDARILLLTQQLQGPNYTRLVRDSATETVSEPESTYQKEGKKKKRDL